VWIGFHRKRIIITDTTDKMKNRFYPVDWLKYEIEYMKKEVWDFCNNHEPIKSKQFVLKNTGKLIELEMICHTQTMIRLAV
jgi:hypothetical protein